jgi:hypothetical protein
MSDELPIFTLDGRGLQKRHYGELLALDGLYLTDTSDAVPTRQGKGEHCLWLSDGERVPRVDGALGVALQP